MFLNVLNITFDIHSQNNVLYYVCNALMMLYLVIALVLGKSIGNCPIV